MRYHALITDYDGTLTSNEHVSQRTIDALIRLKATGRKLILVTGRELEELRLIFPEHTLFDCVVAENGAVIFRPATNEIRTMGTRPPASFIEYLQNRDVPVAIGRVIVATWEPHQFVVLKAIKLFGLEHQLIFNKTAVMILPPGINKASGLREALREFNLSFHSTVAVGDAENDCAMFNAAECAVAVNNALPYVKSIADWTTSHPSGEGIVELIDQLLHNDLSFLADRLTRHYLDLGQKADGTHVQISSYGNNLLIAGASGSGKTTLSLMLLEKMTEQQYQFCVIDPEGDYDSVPGALYMGDSSHAPAIEQVLTLLAKPDENVILCILAIPLSDRPAYFGKLIRELAVLRKQTGHPHFIVIDEAHHVIPNILPGNVQLPSEVPENFLAITTTPELINPAYLSQVNIALLVGDAPVKEVFFITDQSVISSYLQEQTLLQKGEVLVWRQQDNSTELLKSYRPHQLLTRHKRKYAAGDMGANSFYFKGPDGLANLRANNLMLFIDLGRTVNEDTWQYHLKRHDYSHWFRDTIKDEKLADAAENIELECQTAGDSRQAIINLILDRYTAPA
jgi:hydroxymethylpyrimidine pyrophosphatase-like HAD family hydrolase/GTPase SAR1 family protein